MTTLMLERPTPNAVGLEGRRRRELRALVEQLEAWLPAEEAVLTRGRAERRPMPRREARWHTMLRLYERLCLALEG